MRIPNALNLGTAWTFEIPGPPVPKGRPRRNNKTGNWYTPTRTQDAERHVMECAMAAGVRLEPKKPYGIEMYFFLSARPRDIDNLGKLVMDSLGTLGKNDGWNDRQIVDMYARVVSVKSAQEEKTVVRVGEHRSIKLPGDNRGL